MFFNNMPTNSNLLKPKIHVIILLDWRNTNHESNPFTRCKKTRKKR